MGGDSCAEGRGFESQHHILDCLFEKTKINEKDVGDGTFFNKINYLNPTSNLLHSAQITPQY